MSSTTFQPTEMLRKYFPGCVYALFIATTQVIYEPADEYAVVLIPIAHCGKLQQTAFWLIFTICCILIAVMGQTHENTKGGGSFYDINKCFHWKFYSWDNVIHIIAALISFVALALCGHDASICLGIDPKDTQYIPAITAVVFSLVWQALCPTQPKWFEQNKAKFNSPSGSSLGSDVEDSFCDSLKVQEEDWKQQHIEMKSSSNALQENQSVTSVQKIVDHENFNVKLKQSGSSQNWTAFYATFPRYHCAAFNSLQAMILADPKEWGRMVLVGLYILQSVLIIIRHTENRSKD